MSVRRFQSAAGVWSLKTGLLAAVAMLGMVASSEACNRGGATGGTGGGSPGGGGGAGGMGTASMAQAMMVAQASQMAQSQMQAASNQYVANMRAQHNMMLQQIHQRQAQQLEATRLAHMKKKAASTRAIEVSIKSKGKFDKPTKSGGPSV